MTSFESVDRAIKRARSQNDIRSLTEEPLEAEALSLASPEEFLPAALKGDELAVASALRNPLTDPNIANEIGRTALTMAAGKGHESVVKVLLADERIDPNLSNVGDDFTALTWACMHRHKPVVKLLLADERVDPNIRSCRGETTLYLTVRECFGGSHASLVRMLLADKRVDPNIPEAVYGETPLAQALGMASFQGMPPAGEIIPSPSVVELLVSERTIRARPPANKAAERAIYDHSLPKAAKVRKHRRNLVFKGLIRAVVALRRMRLRAAQAVYAPGGTGFAAAAASFHATAGAF